MTTLDGKLYSKYIEAMWSTIQRQQSKGPAEVVLETLDSVSQKTLARVIQTLYTGQLKVDLDTVEDLEPT